MNDTITLEEFSKGGELEDKTLSNDILEVTFNADDSSEGGFNAMYMNGEAHVKELRYILPTALFMYWMM